MASEDGSVAGVPFYLRAGECQQQTVWQEDVRKLTLQVLAVTEAKSGEAAAETVIHTSAKHVRGEALEAAVALRQMVQRLNSAAEIPELIEAFDELPMHNPNAWVSDSALVLASNTNTRHQYVDYSQKYYFNGNRPFIGSAAVAAEIGPDGTLAKASAEMETKTIETLLAQVPLSEFLASKLIPSGAEPTFVAAEGVTAYRAVLAVEPATVMHTLVRTTPLTRPCPQVESISPTLVREVAYTRAIATGTVKPVQPTNAIGISGQIVLPAVKK